MTRPDAVLTFSSILIIFLHFQVHVPLLPDAVLAVGQPTIAVAEENALPVLRLALQEQYMLFYDRFKIFCMQILEIYEKKTS